MGEARELLDMVESVLDTARATLPGGTAERDMIDRTAARVRNAKNDRLRVDTATPDQVAAASPAERRGIVTLIELQAMTARTVQQLDAGLRAVAPAIKGLHQADRALYLKLETTIKDLRARNNLARTGTEGRRMTAINQNDPAVRFARRVRESAGRPVAYHPVRLPLGGWFLAEVIDGEKGYRPARAPVFPTRDAATDAADIMNDAVGTSAEDAMRIIGQSFR